MRRFGLIVLALSLFCVTACEKFDSEAPEKYFARFIHKKLPKNLPDGWYFEVDSEGKKESWRGNSVGFYFMDEQGNELIDINDKTTWPVPCYNDEYLDDPLLYYEGRLAEVRNVWFHPGVGYNFFSVSTVPVDGRHIKTFPLYFQGRHYEMKLIYLYDGVTRLSGSSNSGENKRSTYTHIFRWELDGHYVYSDFERPQKKDVFVTIDKDGDIVSVRCEKTASRVNLFQ